MIIPTSTYRIQLSRDFTFGDLQKILDYLEDLGVSTLYCGPFFQARKGSTHGYDIIDPFHINREIGTLKTLRDISRTLRTRGMSWLQDIVPNHMAYDGSNHWLQEIFELGPESPCCHHFDIDWREKKVLAPFLGDPLEGVLDKREIKLEFKKSGFVLLYYDTVFPLSRKSYSLILSKEQPWTGKFEEFQGNALEWKALKKSFLESVSSDETLKDQVERSLQKINESREMLEALLKQQYFQLTYWKTTEKKINYRRFFTINHLICLRMEDPKVFQSYHGFIEDLVREDLVQGLRVDHIDGLFDPLQYLRRLRSLAGPDFYLIIEKILEWDEDLPDHWPVAGTSGYAFLAQISQLTTDGKAEPDLTRLYQKINPSQTSYEELVYDQKRFILKERMGGEFDNLWTRAIRLKLVPEPYQTRSYKEALGAILSAFPVYRIYPENYPLNKVQVSRIHQATEKARKYAPELSEALQFWKEIFLGEAGKGKEEMLSFLQRCQQFTGPLAAKGGEDTSFYIFNRLISHNEVGDSPENFGLSIAEFHRRMEQRKKAFPLSINATATHDTKRGEDARMRINVLSEFQVEWQSKVKEWYAMGSAVQTNGAPDDNEAYFIFQMMVGNFPFDLEVSEDFIKRSKAYLEKVLREAKIHSSWAKPDTRYENALSDYLEGLLRKEAFLSSFLPFQKKVMAYGALKSLSQCVIKSTAPGIPDIYQGSELWDLSYVDPDNRRPVDYDRRARYLRDIRSFDRLHLGDELDKLKTKYADGKIKLYCLHKLLALRKDLQEVFDQGEYLPLNISDSHKEEVIAYARVEEGQYVLVVVPVLVSRIFKETLQPKKELLSDPVLEMPISFPRKWKNIFTDRTVEDRKFWKMEDLFQEFPVSVLKSIN